MLSARVRADRGVFELPVLRLERIDDGCAPHRLALGSEVTGNDRARVKFLRPAR